MEILIPTYGRWHKQTTWQALPEEIRKSTFLIVQDREKHRYLGQFSNVVVLPPHIMTIGPTRQWMIEQFGPKQVQLDDDLVFATRRIDDPTKFIPASDYDIMDMFGDIEDKLEEYAQVGVASREGGNRNTEEFMENTRITRIFGLRTDIMQKEGVRFDRLPCKVDFDITLQLLRKGYKNLQINWIVNNQNGSNTVGGCSHFRTKEVLEGAAHKLAELHPGLVTVVKKTTKGAWGGGERTDVRIQWKRAYDSAGVVRVLGDGARDNTYIERVREP